MEQNTDDLPDWVTEFPQTPLNQVIEGKIYDHLLFCNASRYQPKGSCCCSCLNTLGITVDSPITRT